MPSVIADPSDIPPYLLAGGRSSRMGSNKAFVLLGGRPLLAFAAARIRQSQRTPPVLNADADWPDAAGMRLVPDIVSGKLGPLAGVLTAMRDAAAARPEISHVLTIPVDSPFFPLDLTARLADAVGSVDDIAIAASGGRDHPVFGLWPVSAAGDLETWLRNDGKRRVRDFLMRHSTRVVEFPFVETATGSLDPFFNINTRDDLDLAEQWLPAFNALEETP
jgi:molybdopterin-guanine dinucleotide biosynthesis protein A